MPSPELDLTNITATNTCEAFTATAQWSLSGRIDESQPNRQFGIHSTPFTIGRRPESCLSIQTGCISKNHAEIHLLDEDQINIEFPIENYPEKVKSLNFDKTPEIEGVLQGIKGQYLILDTGVINIRKFGGYLVEFSA